MILCSPLHFGRLLILKIVAFYCFLIEERRIEESEKAEQNLWDSMITAPTEALEMIMDPNKKEREEEENLKREVKASKKQWRKIRQERFQFLDSNLDTHGTDEKKTDP